MAEQTAWRRKGFGMCDTFDFTSERKLYNRLRPTLDDDDCLFVPDWSSGHGGYVTFDSDAQRLRSVVRRLRWSESEVCLFNAGAVLWLLDASVERARDLRNVCGRFVYVAH
jgi:hypothetical protein